MKFLLKIIKFAIVITVILAVVYFYTANVFYEKKYEDIVKKCAEKYDVEENLIYAIMKVESGFNYKASSKAGAKGLMQIMDTTAEEISKKIEIENYNMEMLYEPEINIEIGTKYYKMLYDKYKSMKLALIAYNAGQGNVDKWLQEGRLKTEESYLNLPFNETTAYWQKVLREYNIYNKIYCR